MINLPYSIRRELDCPAPRGQRHIQLVKLATALTGRGFSSSDLYSTLRPRYGPDVPDREITEVIQWAAANCRASTDCRRIERDWRPKRLSSGSLPRGFSPEANIQRFLAGFTCEESDLYEASPLRSPEDWREDLTALLENLYSPWELVNIVVTCSIHNGKAKPSGHGTTLESSEWLRRIQDGLGPTGDGGAWIRMNPVDGEGEGDRNVTVFRFALLEFDSIPLETQVCLLARLPIPICAILTSGGRSLHAWVRVDAPDLETYREMVSRILRLLAPYGVDTANKNASRLSRCPGVIRRVGGSGDNRQRLLYLNPAATESIPILENA